LQQLSVAELVEMVWQLQATVEQLQARVAAVAGDRCASEEDAG